MVKELAKSPVGTSIIPKPINTIIVVKNLPPIVIGNISPYPTVVNVATAHHKKSKTDENTSGWASFSKK